MSGESTKVLGKATDGVPEIAVKPVEFKKSELARGVEAAKKPKREDQEVPCDTTKDA